MLGTERILVNGQRALVERLGLGIAPHLPATLSLTMALGLQLIRSRPHYREHYLSPSKGTHEVRSQRPQGVVRREIGNVVRHRLGAFLMQAHRRAPHALELLRRSVLASRARCCCAWLRPGQRLPWCILDSCCG